MEVTRTFLVAVDSNGHTVLEDVTDGWEHALRKHVIGGLQQTMEMHKSNSRNTDPWFHEDQIVGLPEEIQSVCRQALHEHSCQMSKISWCEARISEVEEWIRNYNEGVDTGDGYYELVEMFQEFGDLKIFRDLTTTITIDVELDKQEA